MNSEITTIKLRKSTVDILNKLKIHSRQAYEEVILKFVTELKSKKIDFSSNDLKGQVTTIKLHKKTIGILNSFKIHPRQPYEEVILALIKNGKA